MLSGTSPHSHLEQVFLKEELGFQPLSQLRDPPRGLVAAGDVGVALALVWVKGHVVVTCGGSKVRTLACVSLAIGVCERSKVTT